MAPSKVSIDGAFGDWNKINGDTLQEIENPNIDMVEFATFDGEQEIDFYLNVDGAMLGGSIVPQLPARSLQVDVMGLHRRAAI